MRKLQGSWGFKQMSKQWKYLFGPVASRRLGRSLGVDIVPLKTCTQNCVYCQLGINGEQVVERGEYVPINEVLKELQEWLKEGLDADHITLSGSGEPTLNSGTGTLIEGIKSITDIPVAVITNGTLFSNEQVRKDCAMADVVLPSLDAGDEETFSRINWPHGDISFSSFVDGLCKFSNEYSGQIWLEVFFVEGVNTSDDSIMKIKKIIEKIQPDKVQLNTSVRPVADNLAVMVKAEQLDLIAGQLGCGAEIIADFSKLAVNTKISSIKENILAVLERRPCDLNGICQGLGLDMAQAQKVLTKAKQDGLIETITKDGIDFFKKI
ncbi:MAG: radical SAM protein [Sedimentisphaerales bacterium]|nr:radical SAM protein [Sedimentisphaerales bacterium]